MNSLYITLNGMIIIGVPAYHIRINLDSVMSWEHLKIFSYKEMRQNRPAKPKISHRSAFQNTVLNRSNVPSNSGSHKSALLLHLFVRY
jgi:hypothetical protein